MQFEENFKTKLKNTKSNRSDQLTDYRFYFEHKKEPFRRVILHFYHHICTLTLIFLSFHTRILSTDQHQSSLCNSFPHNEAGQSPDQLQQQRGWGIPDLFLQQIAAAAISFSPQIVLSVSLPGFKVHMGALCI